MAPKNLWKDSTLEVIHDLALALANEISEFLFKDPVGPVQQHLKTKHVFQKKYSWLLTTLVEGCTLSKLLRNIRNGERGLFLPYKQYIKIYKH